MESFQGLRGYRRHEIERVCQQQGIVQAFAYRQTIIRLNSFSVEVNPTLEHGVNDSDNIWKVEMAESSIQWE